MNLVIGTILYNSELEVFARSIQMLLRQSIYAINPDFRLSLFIQDNNTGTQIDELKFVLSQIPEIERLNIRLVKSPNVGFAAGHNNLFRNACEVYGVFEYYLCMNPDSIPHHHMLQELLGMAVLNQNEGIFEAREFPLENPKQYDRKTGKTNWCAASCLLIPANLMRELGGFDDFFTMYMEDVDFSWRTKLADYECYTCSSALYYNYQNPDSNGQIIEKRIMISAYKLAWKYQDKQFQSLIRDMLVTLTTEQELKNIDNQLSKHFTDYTYPIGAMRKTPHFINFSHGLSFASTRW
jgi:N-acetylglucosaminyl-diphospho-decaprenol L-rhamnosyltransferase